VPPQDRPSHDPTSRAAATCSKRTSISLAPWSLNDSCTFLSSEGWVGWAGQREKQGEPVKQGVDD